MKNKNSPPKPKPEDRLRLVLLAVNAARTLAEVIHWVIQHPPF
jgi:hypothetical protein